MKFERNLGLIDRILRTGIGVAMMYVGFPAVTTAEIIEVAHCPV